MGGDTCPNLLCLSIDEFKMDYYSITNSTSLVKAEVGSFFDYSWDTLRLSFSHWSKVAILFRDVKHLKIENYWYKFLCGNVESPEGLSYRNLEHLELRTGYATSDLCGMAALFEICPNITTLIIHDTCLY